MQCETPPMRGKRTSVSTTLLAAAAASIFFLAATTANAADDRFDRSKFGGMGGFQPISNDTYKKECGACHFAYLPGFLPARSWERVMSGLNNHFGENLQLSEAQSTSLRQYLAANAADKVPDKGPSVLLERLDADMTPGRVTQMPVIRRQHLVVRSVLQTNTHATKAVGGITNCDSCHEKAAEGQFALQYTVVPGVTKVVKPGGVF